ncbi:MAG: RIP metalloprotease RseP [Phycisphaerales bacterium]|nr:RIP metalloprotease RseP [Phycisphaerales bacterium]
MLTTCSINWIGGITQLLQFILSFSILIIIHELGHFLTAKHYNCRVEKFYLFFNPWFSIYKKQYKGTEFGLGWIPFGGYVKISGMIDESMDKKQLEKPAEPYEFRSKKPLPRLIIMVGGVFMNIILALVIFIFVRWTWGEELLPLSNLKYGIVADSIGREIGLKDGDRIVKIGNKELNDIRKVNTEILINNADTLTVDRGNTILKLAISPQNMTALFHSKGIGLFHVRVPYVVDGFADSSYASKAGLKIGDQIIAINSTTTPFSDDVFTVLKKAQASIVTLTVLRNDADTVQITTPLMSNHKIGVYQLSDFRKLGFVIIDKRYTFLSSIPAGLDLCVTTLENYLKGIQQLFRGKVKAEDSLGSVISISKAYHTNWDWESFWLITAIFSIILAFMNILPIPALDGGHALFCIIEIITGKKPSTKVMEISQTIGMILLFSLMIYALGLDIFRLFK